MPTATRTRDLSTRPRTKSIAQIQTLPTPTDEQIRRRAYEIFVARGDRPGSPEGDWRQAELELRGRMELLGKA